MRTDFVFWNKILLILLVSLLIPFSGCIQPSGQILGPGVVILDFSPDFKNVNSGDKVKLLLKVQNQGATKAKNVRVEIAGIDWSGRLTESLGNLMPVDLEENTPGEVQTRQFILTAPRLAKGVKYTYHPIAKVSYDYNQITTKAITVVNVDELRRLIQQGRGPEVKSVFTSGGPLSVEVRTGKYVKTGPGVYNKFPLYIKIINTLWEQGGTTISKGRIRDIDYPVNIKIETEGGGLSADCGGFVRGSGRQGTIELWKGKDAELTCTMTVTERPTYRVDKLIHIKLDYRYQIEAKTDITVTGRGHI